MDVSSRYSIGKGVCLGFELLGIYTIANAVDGETSRSLFSINAFENIPLIAGIVQYGIGRFAGYFFDNKRFENLEKSLNQDSNDSLETLK